MKNINIIIAFFIAILTVSCEEVVDVPLETAPPRLVVEAAINCQIGAAGNEQKITLTTTAGYYDTVVPAVNNAVVTITNSLNTVFTFTEVSNSGVYVCNDFKPVLNETYDLKVVTDGEVYTASETLNPVAPITKIEQEKGVFSADVIEIRALFNDPVAVENYYLFEYNHTNLKVAEYSANNDEFYNGNEFFSNYFSDEILPGDVIQITHYGISKSYYNFMNIVVSLAGQSGGGPFQSPPATVRGNIINETNTANYALGYFSVSQIDTKLFTVE